MLRRSWTVTTWWYPAVPVDRAYRVVFSPYRTCDVALKFVSHVNVTLNDPPTRVSTCVRFVICITVSNENVPLSLKRLASVVATLFTR